MLIEIDRHTKGATNRMYCTRKVNEDITWVGGNDRRLAMFEGVYSIPDGVSYNSYLILDEKTILFDTVDKAVAKVLHYTLKRTKLWLARAAFLANTPADASPSQACTLLSYVKSKRFAACTVCLKNSSPSL